MKLASPLRLRSWPQRSGIRPRVIHLLSLFTLFSSLALVSAARAEDKTAARDHWERGTKFYDLGKYDDAIHEFESAYEAKGDPAFLYNLAQSHRLAGHPSDSLRFYRTYLRYVPKPPNRADIDERIKELEKIVAERPGGDAAPSAPPIAPPAPSTQVNPPAPTPAPPTNVAPQVSPRAAWPVPTGPESPGVVPAAVPESLPPPPQVAPIAPLPGGSPAPSPMARPGSGRRTAGIALGAAGGGLFVVGAIFGLVAKSQSNKVETATVFDPSTENLGKTAQALQWVGYIAGGAALATGIFLYATTPSTSSDDRPPPPRVALSPLVGPRTGGALLRLTF